jgi:hypothetical protein
MALIVSVCDHSDGSLLRDRDFRLVAGSVGLSALGDWVAIVALGLHVKEMTDSGFGVAALWVCFFRPSVAVAGHAGLLSTASRRLGYWRRSPCSAPPLPPCSRSSPRRPPCSC